MNPHIIITDHAVDQYVARCAPDATDPRADLHMLAASARSLRRRTYRGQPLWATNRANVLLVTKHDRACGIVCVTVITPEMEDARRADVEADDAGGLGCRAHGLGWVLGLRGMGAGSAVALPPLQDRRIRPFLECRRASFDACDGARSS